MLASDLMKLAQPAFCSWGTSAPVLSVMADTAIVKGARGPEVDVRWTKEADNRRSRCKMSLASTPSRLQAQVVHRKVASKTYLLLVRTLCFMYSRVGSGTVCAMRVLIRWDG